MVMQQSVNGSSSSIYLFFVRINYFLGGQKPFAAMLETAMRTRSVFV